MKQIAIATIASDRRRCDAQHRAVAVLESVHRVRRRDEHDPARRHGDRRAAQRALGAIAVAHAAYDAEELRLLRRKPALPCTLSIVPPVSPLSSARRHARQPIRHRRLDAINNNAPSKRYHQIFCRRSWSCGVAVLKSLPG